MSSMPLQTNDWLLGPIDLSLLGPRLPAKELEKLSIFDLLGYIAAANLHPGGAEASAKLIDLANVQPGQRVFEIGCGSGATSSYLASLGCNVLALDKSHYMLDACTKRPAYDGSISLLHGDIIEPVNLSADSVDLVVCEGVMGFVRDRDKAFKEARRLVKKNGLMTSIEFFYTNQPSDLSVRYMNESLRLDKPMLLSDWYSLFNATGWQIVDETIHELPVCQLSGGGLGDIAEQLEAFLNDDSDAATVLRKRFDEYERASALNRRHLRFAARLLRPV